MSSFSNHQLHDPKRNGLSFVRSTKPCIEKKFFVLHPIVNKTHISKIKNRPNDLVTELVAKQGDLYSTGLAERSHVRFKQFNLIRRRKRKYLHNESIESGSDLQTIQGINYQTKSSAL